MRSKILSLLLCLCLVTLIFTSCKDPAPQYDEIEVVSAAEALIKKSLILNEIYWGEGIRYEIPENEEDIKGYLPADKEYLAELEKNYGIKDLETLKTKTREVFSETGYNWILRSCLTNVVGDTGIVSYARYYTSTKDEATGAEDALMVYTAARNIYEKTESVEYIYEGMFVSKVENEIYTVSLKVKTTGIDGSTAERDFTVQLINEKSVGWRLHGASYATHY